MPHQRLGEPKLAVCAHHAETRNVPVLNAICRLLLHLGEDIAHNLRGVGVGVREVDGDVGELWPRERVVEVVFEEVVFGEVGDVGELDVGEVGGLELADIHRWLCGAGGGSGGPGSWAELVFRGCCRVLVGSN